MAGKGKSRAKKIERFKKEHPEGRKEFARVKRMARLEKQEAKLLNKANEKKE